MKPESSVNVSARAPPAFVRAGAAGNPRGNCGKPSALAGRPSQGRYTAPIIQPSVRDAGAAGRSGNIPG